MHCGSLQYKNNLLHYPPAHILVSIPPFHFCGHARMYGMGGGGSLVRISMGMHGTTGTGCLSLSNFPYETLTEKKNYMLSCFTG